MRYDWSRVSDCRRRFYHEAFGEFRTANYEIISIPVKNFQLAASTLSVFFQQGWKTVARYSLLGLFQGDQITFEVHLAFFALLLPLSNSVANRLPFLCREVFA